MTIVALEGLISSAGAELNLNTAVFICTLGYDQFYSSG